MRFDAAHAGPIPQRSGTREQLEQAIAFYFLGGLFGVDSAQARNWRTVSSWRMIGS